MTFSSLNLKHIHEQNIPLYLKSFSWTEPCMDFSGTQLTNMGLDQVYHPDFAYAQARAQNILPAAGLQANTRGGERFTIGAGV